MNFQQAFVDEIEKLSARPVSPAAEEALLGGSGAQYVRRFGLDPVDKRKLKSPWGYGGEQLRPGSAETENKKLKEIIKKHKKRGTSPTSAMQKGIDTASLIPYLTVPVAVALGYAGLRFPFTRKHLRSMKGFGGSAGKSGKMYLDSDVKKAYSKLGIRKGASPAEAKKEYMKLVKRWHPDLNPEDIAKATRKTQEFNAAADILRDLGKMASTEFGLFFAAELSKEAKKKMTHGREQR